MAIVEASAKVIEKGKAIASHVLEASASQKEQADEAEWYYCQGADTKNRLGPVGFQQLMKLHEAGEFNSKETRFWAQGMEGWRTMREIPQMKWSVWSCNV